VATTNKYLKGDLPIAISTNIPTALVRYQREDFAASYAIGNTPWLSAASDNNRISRITTTYQKERIDQSATAGEQSLSNWWLRSATSWHHGAGERYYDAESSDLYRYYESNNIDPWTIGELKLLPATTQLSTSGATHPATVSGGTFFIQSGLVKFYNGSTTTSTSLGTSTTAQTLTSDGVYALVGASDGIYQVSTALAVTKLWSKPVSTTTITVQAIGYVKDRIIAGVMHNNTDVHLYELSRNPSSPPATMSNSEDRFSYPNTSLVFNSVSELPGSITVGYTQGTISKVQSYTVSLTSPLAAINDPIIIAELPRGETLNQIRIYLNEFVVLATSKGIRVGTISTDGSSFTYGPLNVEGNVSDIAFDQSYVYGTRDYPISGSTGLWRINLGQVVGKQPVSLLLNSDPDNTGTLGFTIEDQDDQLVSIGSVPLGMSTEITLAGYIQPADHFEITFNLTRDSSDTTKSPILEEWQVRALPAPQRSRTLTIPLLCYEEERDPNGNTRISIPWERISYLERVEQNGGAVLFQDFSSGEERICVIRAIQFEQAAPPTFASGFGGIVTVQLQTIDTEQVIA